MVRGQAVGHPHGESSEPGEGEGREPREGGGRDPVHGGAGCGERGGREDEPCDTILCQAGEVDGEHAPHRVAVHGGLGPAELVEQTS
jgi:hypothetical protein